MAPCSVVSYNVFLILNKNSVSNPKELLTQLLEVCMCSRSVYKMSAIQAMAASHVVH